MANFSKTLLLFVVMAGLFILIGGAAAGKNGMIIAFALAMLFNLAMYWFSAALALRQYNAREITQAEAPKLYYMIEELAARAQIPMPKAYVADSPALNAFATGRSPSTAVVCVTTGLMRHLNEPELRGVLAHEISHVKNWDMLTGTLAAGFAMAIDFIAKFTYYFGGSRSERRGGNPVAALLLLILGPLVFMLIRMAISRSREYGADEDGAKLAGSTEGLASALTKIRDTQMQGIVMPGSQETAHLMIAPVALGSRLAEMFSTHPNINTRIEKLRALNIYGR